MRWRQNPQRVAWIILTTSFVACCIITVTLPLVARAFVLHSTRPLYVSVTTTAGTVQVVMPGANEPNAVPERRDIPEASQVVTDDRTQALVIVSSDPRGEEQLASLQLFPGSSLRIQTARRPRFAMSPDPHRIFLSLEKGRARIASASNSRPVEVQLETPQACAMLGDGTLDVAIRGQDTQVTALSGVAQVLAAGAEVRASGGQRVSITEGRAPGLPVPAEQNLVRNGTFEGDLAPYWREVVDVTAGYPPGQITRDTSGARSAVRFSRHTEDGAPNMVGIRQALDTDVQAYDSLVVQLDVLVRYHSVPGGGQLNSEYPVMIDIFYRDIYGKDLHWYQGFYHQELPPGSTYNRPTGQRVPLGVWYTYESPNLVEALRDTWPAHIYSVTISASGHDYDSQVSSVAIIAR